MNAVPADSPPPASPAPAGGWTRRKLAAYVALAVAVHLGFVFVFGSRKPIVPRAVGAIPHLQISAGGDELIALGDPTLFVRPHQHDFVTRYWQRIQAPPPPPFGWSGSPQFLALNVDDLGSAFRGFMATNGFDQATPDFKPEPELSQAAIPLEFAPPPTTLPQVTGDLARRRLLNPMVLPVLLFDDVLAPSKVQVLVDAAGKVLSPVLLESSGHSPADQRAMQLAGQLRFAPAANVMFGEIIFRWRTTPSGNRTPP